MRGSDSCKLGLREARGGGAVKTGNGPSPTSLVLALHLALHHTDRCVPKHHLAAV